MLVDSHCHLNSDDFAGDIAVVLQAAGEQGVDTFLNIACRLEEIEPILKLTEQYPRIFASVGIHPHEAEATYKALASQTIVDKLLPYMHHPRVIAIGETGLDFYYNHSPREMQEKAFHEQIELAIQTNLPLVIHTRNAEDETIHILKQYANKIKGVIHCFSGTQWLADEAMALGFYISFSGIVTFPKATDIQETAKNIPLNRMLVETDAPFLAPIPKRGKRNEPAFIVHTAQFIADLKGVTFDVIAQHTTDNFYHLFDRAERGQA